MIKPKRSFFSATLHCLRRTKEQRIFEEELYKKGLENEEKRMTQKLNEAIVSKDFAVKFVLQELDVARKGDTFLQYFVKKSGFHISEYSGALEKFQQEQEEIEKIQAFFLDFLNKISDDKIMFQTAMNILNGVMEHWEIGKYSKERDVIFEEEAEEEVSLVKGSSSVSLSSSLKKLKTIVMQKLLFLDKQIQNLLDTFSMPKESTVKETETVSKESVPKVEPLYTDADVNALMEKHSHIIQDIITGEVHPENEKEIQIFQEQISLAALEGNNLASVFCAFFEIENSFPISDLDDKSKMFFIKILNTFEAEGFSESLYEYFDENRETVYALATTNDRFMQYLVAFWYVLEDEDEAKALEEQHRWYSQSALNGFEPAIEKMKNSNNEGKL